MTADLTPFVARKQAFRRKLAWQTLGMAASATAVVVALGFTPEGFAAIMLLLTGFGKGMHRSWQQQYQLARAELSDATMSLETQRALLRGSGERRDAAQGLALTDDPSGGEVSLGQDGELDEDR